MVSLTFGLFTQVSGSGPLGPLVFIKRNNFCDILFSAIDKIAILNLVLPLKERICSQRSKLFSLRGAHVEKVIKNESDIVASCECVSIHRCDIRQCSAF